MRALAAPLSLFCMSSFIAPGRLSLRSATADPGSSGFEGQKGRPRRDNDDANGEEPLSRELGGRAHLTEARSVLLIVRLLAKAIESQPRSPREHPGGRGQPAGHEQRRPEGHARRSGAGLPRGIEGSSAVVEARPR